MRTPLVLLPLALMAGSVSIAADSARIQIVLDVSGSMRSSLGSQVKIDAAKSAIRETVSGLPNGSVVALRYYGHRVAQERKDESCKDTELVVQFQPLDKARFLGALDKAVPRGQTPIAYSLQQAAQDFGAPSDEERAMILVSDGIETCGGDPLATVRDLTAKGFKVKVHTIGFDVDAAARAQLEAISGATGGEYFDARSASALAETLGKLTQRALLITRESAFGEAIRGGAKYDEAVALKPATTYHLDHHQRKNEYDYFAIDARDGQKIVASIQAFEKGVDHPRRQVRRRRETPYTGIAIHAPDQRNIVDRWVANPGTKATVSVPIGAGQGGRFFILVGNEHGSAAPEQPFRCHARRSVRRRQRSRRRLGRQQGRRHPAWHPHRLSLPERFHRYLRLRRLAEGEVQHPRQTGRAREDDRPRGLGPRRGQGERGRGGECRRRGTSREPRVPV